jgi:hypothetical protein
MKVEQSIQLSFKENGCIAPCPYTDKCTTYGVGCQGGCYWCGRFDKQKAGGQNMTTGKIDSKTAPNTLGV